MELPERIRLFPMGESNEMDRRGMGEGIDSADRLSVENGKTPRTRQCKQIGEEVYWRALDQQHLRPSCRVQ